MKYEKLHQLLVGHYITALDAEYYPHPDPGCSMVMLFAVVLDNKVRLRLPSPLYIKGEPDIREEA